MFPVDIAKFSGTDFFYRTPSLAASESPTTIKSAGVLVLWFYASACFRFWSKTCTKRCTNKSLLSRDNTISSLLELICHVLSISEYILEKHQLLLILIKKLHKALHKYGICDMSISWKTEYAGKRKNVV